MAKQIAIVGGGITGLAAAYELEKTTDAEIHVYEGADRLGGKLQTAQIGDLLVEGGPDCFFSRKPGVLELVKELGIEDQIVEPIQKEFAMLVDGKLHTVPGGLVTLTYSQPDAVREATFLSETCKARVLDEANQPKGEGEDESLRRFFDRRFGVEFTRLVVEPLLAGTHGGDPDRLSMRALYPGYFDLEQKYGSLAAGMPAPASGSKRPTFLSFRGGMRTLVDALANRLTRTQVHLNAPVETLEDLTADQILLAIPANRAATLVPATPAELLNRIEHRTTTIVTFAFRRDDIGHPLNNTGFLVPPSIDFPVTGATWSSRKWPERAPQETVLMRVFGRAATDEASALGAIRPLLEISGEPIYSRLDRWSNAQPQYNVGHLDRIAEIDDAMRVSPKVTLAGTSYRGVGIPDCLRQGREAGRTIAERL